ncbi:MAG: hypothetical protein V1907_02515 [Candidatus Kerfeldbacteria bacterium]
MAWNDELYFGGKEMKTFLLTATYLIGVGELILAVYFWITRSGNTTRKVMVLLTFSTGMWVVLTAATSYVGETTLTILFMKLVFVFGILLMTALLHLILVFPSPLFRVDAFHVILLYIPTGIFSAISLSSKAIVEGFTGSSTISGIIIPGPVYNTYNIFLCLPYLAGLVVLYYRRNKLDGVIRANVSILFWSIVFGGAPAVVIDLIIPIAFPTLYINTLWANLATVIWLGAITYVVRRRR